jgi:hypothetical protein
MFVSLTRLRIRSLPAWLQFVRNNEGVVRQAIASPGFIRGKLLVDGFRTFWTMTLWQDESSMPAYRGSGAHGSVMGSLPRWCDEASVAHWTQNHDELPDWQEAHRRMCSEGRPSRVDHPTPDHQNRRIRPPRVFVQRPLTPPGR